MAPVSSSRAVSASPVSGVPSPRSDLSYRWFDILLVVLGVVVFLSFSYLVFQAVQYYREASAAAASEAKDLEASSVTDTDTERKSCSITDDTPPPVTEEVQHDRSRSL